MRILFIGDIVGNPGREAIKKLVPILVKEEQLDFVIANAENAAGGSGITPAIAYELFDAGVGAITSGDHIWKKREIFEIIDRDPRVLRPANFPEGTPGKGWGVFTTPSGAKLGVVSVQGRVFMDPMECPFRACRQAIDLIRKETQTIIVDIHAEATSEKVALGWYVDGAVSAVIGTHTHIQTADEKILPQGTAFLADAGMTGPHFSVIGRKIEDVLERFVRLLPRRFDVAEKDVQLQGAIIDVDQTSGVARSITRVQKKLGI